MAAARILKTFEITGVNLKSAVATLIVPVVSGKRFIPRSAWAKIATRTGTGSVPTVKIGNGGSFDVAASKALGTASHVANELVEIPLDGTTRLFAVDIGTTGISVTVTGASTYTTHTADFWLEGFIV